MEWFAEDDQVGTSHGRSARLNARTRRRSTAGVARTRPCLAFLAEVDLARSA
jgi:hypothetical protein